MVDDLPAGMEVAPDVSAADWLTARIWPWPTSDNHVLVGSVVPEGFESYAAVRHEDGQDHDLSERDTDALVTVLTEFTASADECWFCLWTGYGGMDLRGTEQAIVRTPGREYVLLKGPLSAVVAFSWERPKLWWPSDRSWCVGGDIDLARTFVGGTKETIEALAATEELDVEQIPLSVRVDETNDLPRLVEGTSASRPKRSKPRTLVRVPEGSFTCPVCHEDTLAVKPYETWPPPPEFDVSRPPYEDQLGRPSYEVCSTCGFEFGNDDNPGTAAPDTFDSYRAEWQSRD